MVERIRIEREGVTVEREEGGSKRRGASKFKIENRVVARGACINAATIK